ncbi:Stachyose synthase [Thalictrum thalictroides]|uniref:galactinol--sucrose galactosyltransferase n=1 Tax=Thalictrum thalictroides TaxID=46969 RepID=A0A7J6VFB4_THATH|nr:Stachyose synthase [Thalictrum thalictroides]
MFRLRHKCCSLNPKNELPLTMRNWYPMSYCCLCWMVNLEAACRVIPCGDPAVVTSESLKAVFVNSGNSPFDLVKESMKILEKHMGTFSLRETKKMPGMLDWFGWCTWDAFYHQVNPQGVKDGLKSLSDGGTPARFLIIDDGWQDVFYEFTKEGEPFVDGSEFGGRLMSIKENSKFSKKKNEALNEAASDLKDFITDIKRTFGLRYVYVWHALMGYWGGFHPDAPADVQNLLETVASGLGGRVLLTRQFQQALEKSIAANFQDNGIICCMGQSTDSIYHSKRSAITRASDDYWPKNPKTQTLHIAAVSFNSIFLGEVVVPDWDMFYSKHYAAEFHAAARAVGGCGIYVSDKPGSHDFTILKRLVLPDGSVLRAKYPGRPTRDCLFIDPVMDGKSLLKIWNLNTLSGVLGVFNCQGAGGWPGLETNIQNDSNLELSGQISPDDIEYFKEVSGDFWTGDCAVFSFNTGSLTRLPKKGSLEISLKSLQCDVFTISPIKIYNQEVQFAPIGLVEMYNSGGAVEAVNFINNSSVSGININGRGSGSFGAYSSRKPKSCSVNSEEQEFEYRGEDNLLTIMIPARTNAWKISIFF